MIGWREWGPSTGMQLGGGQRELVGWFGNRGCMVRVFVFKRLYSLLYPNTTLTS